MHSFRSSCFCDRSHRLPFRVQRNSQRVVFIRMEKEEGRNKYSKEFKVPQNFDEVLRGLTREILRNQPEDISKFAYEYFANELQARALASD